MFIKVKRQGRKTYFELAHSQRRGAKVVQHSIYLGSTLALTGKEWLDVLAGNTNFQPSIRKVFPAVESFIREHGLPADTIRGLQDATRLQFQLRKPSGAHAVLGLLAGATVAQVRAAFRRLSFKHHPDQGGDPDEFRRLLAARDSLLKSTPTTN